MPSGSTRPSRILYIGDVPVANTRAGAVQLTRILSRHPPDNLRVVESNLSVTQPGEELPGVTYDTMHVAHERLLRTRLSKLYSVGLYCAAKRRGVQLAKRFRAFRPDAVLTVAHRFSWLSAAAAAEELGVPLHIIVHDDPLASAGVSNAFEPMAVRMFAKVYRKAATRLVVSRAMDDHYSAKFGVTADVLYPLWPAGDSPFDSPPDRSVPAGKPITFGYAGSLFSDVYIRHLVELSIAVEPLGHRLAWWTDWSPERIREYGLDRPNIDPIPAARPGWLVYELRERADALFVPMNFAPGDRDNVTINFPSKLTDYTAAGLPILMWAPPYSAAARWAGENPDAVRLVDQPDLESLRAAAESLAADPDARRRSGQAALEAGRKYFSHDAAMRVLAPVLTVHDDQS